MAFAGRKGVELKLDDAGGWTQSDQGRGEVWGFLVFVIFVWGKAGV